MIDSTCDIGAPRHLDAARPEHLGPGGGVARASTRIALRDARRTGRLPRDWLHGKPPRGRAVVESCRARRVDPVAGRSRGVTEDARGCRAVRTRCAARRGWRDGGADRGGARSGCTAPTDSPARVKRMLVGRWCDGERLCLTLTRLQNGQDGGSEFAVVSKVSGVTVSL